MIINQVVSGGGTTPTGTIQITTNGTHNVTNYASADVQVPTTAPDYFLPFTKNTGTLTRSYYDINLNGITTLGYNVFYSLFYNVAIPNNKAITFMSNITNIGQSACYNMFYNTNSHTYSCDLSSVTEIGNSGCENMFAYSKITSCDLSSLTTIQTNGCQYMFTNCSYLSSVDLTSLITIGTNGCAYMFQQTGLTSIDLSGITSVATCGLKAAFKSCTSLTSAKVGNANTTLTGSANYSDMFHSCSNLVSVDVSLPQTIGDSVCQYMFTYTGIQSIDLSSLTAVTGISACYQMLGYCSALTSADLSGLTTVSGNSGCYSMFSGCPMLTSVNLSSLETITGGSGCTNMFSGCNSLQSIDLSSLTDITGNSACYGMFRDCSALTSVNLSNLTNVGTSSCYDMFKNCTNLTSIYLPKITSPNNSDRPTPFNCWFSGVRLTMCDLRNLESCGDRGILDCMFDQCEIVAVNLNALTHIGEQGARACFAANYVNTKNTMSDVYFPMLTSFGANPFWSNGFTQRQNCTIHFRKDAEATVRALGYFSSLWGAGSGSSAVFDLAGTLTGMDGNDYTRSEINSVYASETAGAAKTATAWKYNNTTYYTSGGAEPQVGDTIYSDSACTTAVTTISSIS